MDIQNCMYIRIDIGVHGNHISKKAYFKSADFARHIKLLCCVYGCKLEDLRDAYPFFSITNERMFRPSRIRHLYVNVIVRAGSYYNAIFEGALQPVGLGI